MKAALTDGLRWIPESPMLIEDASGTQHEWPCEGVDNIVGPVTIKALSERGHWRPSMEPDDIAALFYEHFRRWPADHSWAQTLISRAFLECFPGHDGDVFRRMVWPPPLYQYMND